MIQKFIISNNYLEESLELELTKPNLTGIYVKEVTGLGYASSVIPLTELALSDIDYYNHSLFESRNVVFTFGFVTGVDVEEKRQILYKFFPSKVEIKISIVTDKKEVYLLGYVETFEPSIFNKGETVQVSLICPNPYFIGKDMLRVEFKGTPFYPVNNRTIVNGLWYYIIPEDVGIDCLKIIYPNGYLIIGNQERFYDPYNENAISNSIPSGSSLSDVESENTIKPNQGLLIDTNLEGFGIYLTDENGEIISDITSKCKIYGDYPFLSYGKIKYEMLAYSVKQPTNNIQYQFLSSSDFKEFVGGPSYTEPTSNPIFFSPGTEYLLKKLTPIIWESGFNPVDNTVGFKCPRLLVLNIYDSSSNEITPKANDLEKKDPPIERLIGNIIVKMPEMSSIESGKTYTRTVAIVKKKTPTEEGFEGNDLRIGYFEGDTLINISDESQYLANPFYDNSKYKISNEMDFKNVIYQKIFYELPWDQRYYISIGNGQLGYMFDYGDSTENITSSFICEDYHPGL